ncbi:hypothetical protein DFR38_10548 [Aquitalea magnusonii]|uniref:Uncharacterized protein n=1 Tax=Aquitalea magnusonii TaxID=332411 RepID=A0A318JMR6_9NEIS|nr:hypothetical protein [Aquitalea magnusonii]PXX49012.1 hypothetical protein DFR38_10548 [Aquitalea magnusonii]
MMPALPPGESFRFRLAVGKAYRVKRSTREEKRERGQQCLRALLDLLDARMRQADERRRERGD